MCSLSRSPLFRPLLLVVVVAGLVGIPAFAAEPEAAVHTASDSLGSPRDAAAAADRMLRRVAYEARRFEVSVRPLNGASHGGADALVTFASPLPSAEGVSSEDSDAEPADTVRLEWYAARSPQGHPLNAPAILVLHSIDRRLVFGRAIARHIAGQGVHAFVMQMPGFADRSTAAGLVGRHFFDRMVQAAADARRGRDAIAALPHVDGQRVSIVGVSLGSFVTASAAAIDNAFDRVFLLLAGGDLYGLLRNGSREAAHLRRMLNHHGYRGEKLKQLCDEVDPVHLAHRLDPAVTWLYSARFDQVVPAASARALANAAGLAEDHHRWLGTGHYTGMLFLPRILDHVAAEIRRDGPADGEIVEQHSSTAGTSPASE